MSKIKAGARQQHYRLVYFDEAGFSASPPIQYGWGPRGKPHELEPLTHCRRSVPGALNDTDNTLFYQIGSRSVTRSTVVDFLEQIAEQGDERLTFLVLDNARIHHDIAAATKERWLREYNMCLLYLPTYSPELNLIEIVWKQAKYHWRRFISWSKDTLEYELDNVLKAYGDPFAINFS